jgi:glycosyltransferase involved in cell wall biosynthesis
MQQASQQNHITAHDCAKDLISVFMDTGMSSKKLGSMERWLLEVSKYVGLTVMYRSIESKDFLEQLEANHIRYIIRPSIWRLIRELKSKRYNIIHTHFGPSCYRIALVGRILGYRKIIRTLHSGLGHLSALHQIKLRLLLPLFSDILTVSRSLKQQVIRYRLKKPSRIYPIPLGIDLDRYGYARRDVSDSGIPKDAFVIGTVSRSVPVKGIPHLLEALAILCRKHTHVYGLLVVPGVEYEQNLQNITQENLTERIRLLGVREDIANILASIDLFILPSFSEGSPLALVEAMAAGLPCCGSRVEGIEEILSQSPFAQEILFEPGDAQAIVRCVENLLNKKGLQDLGAVNLRIVEENYDLEHCISNLVAFYHDLLGAKAQK